MNYQEAINGVVSSIKTEKVAGEEPVKMSAVEKAAYEIIESLEKIAEDEDEETVEIPEDIAEKLDIKEDEDEEEDGDDEENDDVKEANEVFLKALYLEKEAEEALYESQIMKVAALKVLRDNGICTEDDVEKLASCTLDDIEIEK